MSYLLDDFQQPTKKNILNIKFITKGKIAGKAKNRKIKLDIEQIIKFTINANIQYDFHNSTSPFQYFLKKININLRISQKLEVKHYCE